MIILRSSLIIYYHKNNNSIDNSLWYFFFYRSHLSHDRTIFTGTWTLGMCVKQQCDVGLVTLLTSQMWLFEINKISRAF